MNVVGDTGQPKWRNVADDITRRIDADEWPIGTKISPISRLKAHYDVSRNVVLQALGSLKEDGILRGFGGSGYFVAAKSAGVPLSNQELTQIVRELEERLTRLEGESDASDTDHN